MASTPRTKPAKSISFTMEMYEFIYLFAGKYYLSKADYLAHDFAQDGPLKTYTFDGNFEEYGIWDTIPTDVPMSYTEFFKHNLYHFERKPDDAEWEWHSWPVDEDGKATIEEVKHPIHGLFRNERGMYWNELDTLEKWENFPNDGKIGWRGPTIKTDVLEDAGKTGQLPEVHWIPHDRMPKGHRRNLELKNSYITEPYF